MLRPETKARARALQLLYAWELQDRPEIQQVSSRMAGWDAPLGPEFDAAVALAAAVAAGVAELDAEICLAADNWRLDRIGIIERNILRIALCEMGRGEVPPRVTINEAVRLAHWFAGSKAPGFVNGVLDGLARHSGRL